MIAPKPLPAGSSWLRRTFSALPASSTTFGAPTDALLGVLNGVGLPTAIRACPRCKRDLTAYWFTPGDGLPIATYLCAEHGDVIPLLGIAGRNPHP